MAKAENLSTMERHVEKLVLLVCLLALAFAVWYWIVSSPLELEIVKATGRGKQLVPPARVDDLLKSVAKEVQKVYEETERARVPVPVWAGHLDDVRAMAPLPTLPTDLTSARLPLAPVELQFDPTAQIGLALLTSAMPEPVKPVMMASVELPNKPPLGDVVLARGVGGYSLGKLTADWRGMLKKAVPLNQVVPYKVIVEVQQAPPDGDWAKAKTVVVQTPPMLDANGDPTAMPAIPDFDGSNIQEVRAARDVVRDLWQQQILQPRYRLVWRAGMKQWVEPELPAAPVPAAPAAPPPPRAVAGAPAVPAVPAVPAAPQGPAGIVFFDDSTMTVGPSYRYRIQLVVINPLLTYDEAVAAENVAEARVKFLTCKPSQWSDPVSVGREVHFFVTGANEMARPPKMSVTVYARKWGQWVNKKFDVQPGEPIGGVERVDLVDPLGQGRKSVDVDFSTGATALRLDFKKSILRPGFTTLSAFSTSEMLYLDDDGKLKSRLKTWDDESPLRKRLAEAVKLAAGK